MPHVRVHGVAEMKEFELRKFLRREPKVEDRMRLGEIDDPLIRRLYDLFGGTPGFLVSVRAWLADGDISEWEDEIPEDTPLEEARQAYCERIMLPKLYALLSATGQRMASLLAVSELPLPADGLAMLSGLSSEGAQAAANEAANYGLVQRFAESEFPTRYQAPGLIRGWLSGEPRLSPMDRKASNSALAKFWKKCCETGRGRELQVAVDVELLACRTHARRAELNEEFRWATLHLSVRLERIAEWRQARILLDEIPVSERDGPSWHNLATIDLKEGKNAEARAGFTKALAIFQAIHDSAGQAACRHQLASIDLTEGKNAEARDGFAKVLALRREIGDRAGEAAALNQLASIDLNEGKYLEARRGFNEALDIFRTIPDQAGQVATLINLATIDRDEGKNAEARADFTKALAIFQATHDRVGQAAAWLQLATVDFRMGKNAEARAGFTKALALRREIGDRAGEAAALNQLASIDLNEGKYSEARRGFNEALDIFRTIPDQAGQAATWHNLASIDLAEGNFAKAKAGFVSALVLRKASGDRAGEAAAWYQLGMVAWELGKKIQAAKLVAICLLIDQDISHGNSSSDMETLLKMSIKLGFQVQQILELQESTRDSYQQDRGKNLLAEAFSDIQ